MKVPDNDAWPAPAKLNLLLRILGRRSDGYHELQTVFQFLDYGDWLWFRHRDDSVLTLQGELAGLPTQDNLVLRAARVLRGVAGVRLGVSIHLKKYLPVGGGLGGGSSDAATTLVALNQLWGLHLSVDSLADLGVRLGADVPVFVRGHAAWGEGIGERLVPISPPEPWYLVVCPACSVSTAEIFSAPELTRDSRPITIQDFLAGAGGNDCERVVVRRYPVVGEVLQWLSQFGESRLTGTGACAFVPFVEEEMARAAVAGIPDTWTYLVARGFNRSALIVKVESRKKGFYSSL